MFKSKLIVLCLLQIQIGNPGYSRRPPRRRGSAPHDRWRWRPRLPIIDLGGSRCFVQRHGQEDMRPARRTVYDGIGRVDVGEVRPLVRREEGGEIHRHGG